MWARFLGYLKFKEATYLTQIPSYIQFRLSADKLKCVIKFIYSEKATKFCEISTVVPCSNGQIYSGDFTKIFGFSEYINFKIINRKKDKNICRILSYLRNWTVIIGYKDCMCNQLIMRKIAARVIKLKLIPPSLILQTLAVYTHFFLSRLKF